MLSLKSRWLFCCQLVFFSVVCHSEKSVPNIYGNYVCTGHEIILEIVELSVQILLESDVHGNFQPETSNTRGPNNPGRLLFAFGHAHESQLGSKEVHTASFTGFFDSVISPSNGKNVRNALDAMTNVMNNRILDIVGALSSIVESIDLIKKILRLQESCVLLNRLYITGLDYLSRFQNAALLYLDQPATRHKYIWRAVSKLCERAREAGYEPHWECPRASSPLWFEASSPSSLLFEFEVDSFQPGAQREVFVRQCEGTDSADTQLPYYRRLHVQIYCHEFTHYMPLDLDELHRFIERGYCLVVVDEYHFMIPQIASESFQQGTGTDNYAGEVGIHHYYSVDPAFPPTIFNLLAADPELRDDISLRCMINAHFGADFFHIRAFMATASNPCTVITELPCDSSTPPGMCLRDRKTWGKFYHTNTIVTTLRQVLDTLGNGMVRLHSWNGIDLGEGFHVAVSELDPCVLPPCTRQYSSASGRSFKEKFAPFFDQKVLSGRLGLFFFHNYDGRNVTHKIPCFSLEEEGELSPFGASVYEAEAPGGKDSEFTTFLQRKLSGRVVIAEPPDLPKGVKVEEAGLLMRDGSLHKGITVSSLASRGTETCFQCLLSARRDKIFVQGEHLEYTHALPEHFWHCGDPGLLLPWPDLSDNVSGQEFETSPGVVYLPSSCPHKGGDGTCEDKCVVIGLVCCNTMCFTPSPFSSPISSSSPSVLLSPTHICYDIDGALMDSMDIHGLRHVSRGAIVTDWVGSPRSLAQYAVSCAFVLPAASDSLKTAQGDTSASSSLNLACLSRKGRGSGGFCNLLDVWSLRNTQLLVPSAFANGTTSPNGIARTDNVILLTLSPTLQQLKSVKMPGCCTVAAIREEQCPSQRRMQIRSCNLTMCVDFDQPPPLALVWYSFAHDPYDSSYSQLCDFQVDYSTVSAFLPNPVSSPLNATLSLNASFSTFQDVVDAQIQTSRSQSENFQTLHTSFSTSYSLLEHRIASVKAMTDSIVAQRKISAPRLNWSDPILKEGLISAVAGLMDDGLDVISSPPSLSSPFGELAGAILGFVISLLVPLLLLCGTFCMAKLVLSRLCEKEDDRFKSDEKQNMQHQGSGSVMDDQAFGSAV